MIDLDLDLHSTIDFSVLGSFLIFWHRLLYRSTSILLAIGKLVDLIL